MSELSQGSQKLPARRQASILSRRYLTATLQDPGTLLLLIAQAPFIGYLCTLVWGSIEKDTPSLYFVLSLSAVWFGCIGSCREIVKERAILERERFFGVSLPAYVASKIGVLAIIGLVQVLLLQMAVEWSLGLKGPFPLQTLALFGASLSGTGLGLVVSALSKSQERAVGAVPLLILPQLLFSEFAIPKRFYDNTVEVLEKLMPCHWAYRIFQELAKAEVGWGWVAVSALALMGFALAFFILTTLALVPRREV